MRKSIVATSAVAILGVVALSACDFSFGKKADEGDVQAAAGDHASGGAAEETSSGKPEDDGAGGAAAEGSGGEGEGGKPDEQQVAEAGEATDNGGGGGGSAGMQSVGDVPPDFAQLMDQYLDYYQENFAANGGSSGVRDVTTGLQAGNEYRWNVGTLRGGQTYTFLGACDNDCSDVDLIIEDENGIQVGEDVLTDDYPVVTITPIHDGPFTARILLVNCNVEPCFVGGRVVQLRQ